MPSHRRPRRRPSTWVVRWFAVLLPVLLAVSLFGRGHFFFQVVGMPLACEHPGHEEGSRLARPALTPSPGGAHLARDDRDTGGNEGGGPHHGCPNDCQRCPCGHVPVVVPPYVPSVGPLLDFYEVPTCSPVAHAGQHRIVRLDRPPRRLSA